MSDYVRTTRECSVRELKPELLRAIRDYFREHALGDLEAETVLCCETLSTKKSTGKLISWLSGPADATIYTGMLLTAQQLIWVHHGDRSGTLLNAADLDQIRAGFYSSPFTKDAGLQISGYIGNATGRARGSIGMGAEPAARKFCDEVSQAIAKVNPSSKRGLFTWLSG